jgi:hypothetical protein
LTSHGRLSCGAFSSKVTKMFLLSVIGTGYCEFKFIFKKKILLSGR